VAKTMETGYFRFQKDGTDTGIFPSSFGEIPGAPQKSFGL